MSSQTTNLQLPFIAAGQAQKHVTVNETLLRLDALVQLAVVSATTSAQPGSPNDGEVYILPAGKTGAAWGAMSNHALAYYRDSVWEQIAPREGFVAFVKDVDTIAYYTGSAWAILSAPVSFSATDRILGRVSGGAGASEEIVFTDQAQQLCDDTSFAAMRTTLSAPGLADANAFTNTNEFNKAAAAVTTALVVRNSGVAANGHGVGLRFKLGGAVPASVGIVVADIGTGKSDLHLGTSTDGAEANIVSRLVVQAAGHTVPAADNAYNLGSGSLRFGTVYAATGAINTSDAREKTALQPISEGVKRAIRRVIAGIGVYQWLSSVEAKGADGARLHVGVTAQAVRDAFLAEGEDPTRWGLFCADVVMAGVDNQKAWTRLCVRYDQLFALAIAALFDQCMAGGP